MANKVGNILASSYADLEIRDALETLDARGAQNTPETRRNLRLDVQKEIIHSNAEIVDDFGVVAKQLETVGAALSTLQTTCAEMRRHVSAARVETAPVIDEATTLITQRSQVQTRQAILSAFNEHFLLNPVDLATLTSAAEPITPSFFPALAKLKSIQTDSRILLATEPQRLGLDILETSNRHLASAFQKLYRWTLREFKDLDPENPHVSAQARRALRHLAERPTLFQACLDTFAEAREGALSGAFYAALTGAAGAERPIELAAHEPLRYVGDMLAWAHATAVSEREALEGMFVGEGGEGDEMARSVAAGLESEPWSAPESGEAFDGRTALGQLVNRSLAEVAALLGQRVGQVVRGLEEPVLAYKIANLVVFYRNIFVRLVGEAGFVEGLDEIEGVALERFRETMRWRVEAGEREGGMTVPEDLGPPEELEEALEQLKALLAGYDTSVAESDMQGEALDLVLGEALDPFLESCAKLTEPMDAPGCHVLPINCLLATRATLSAFSFTERKLSGLGDSIQEHATQLAEFQYHWLLQNSGLQPLVRALHDLSRGPEIPADAVRESIAFSPQSLANATEQLDEFLPSAVTDALENVKNLASSTLAHQLIDRAVSRFCDDFSRIESVVVAASPEQPEQSDEDEQDEDREPTLREIFHRTTEDLRILLAS